MWNIMIEYLIYKYFEWFFFINYFLLRLFNEYYIWYE